MRKIINRRACVFLMGLVSGLLAWSLDVHAGDHYGSIQRHFDPAVERELLWPTTETMLKELHKNINLRVLVKRNNADVLLLREVSFLGFVPYSNWLQEVRGDLVFTGEGLRFRSTQTMERYRYVKPLFVRSRVSRWFSSYLGAIGDVEKVRLAISFAERHLAQEIEKKCEFQTKDFPSEPLMIRSPPGGP